MSSRYTTNFRHEVSSLTFDYLDHFAFCDVPPAEFEAVHHQRLAATSEAPKIPMGRVSA